MISSLEANSLNADQTHLIANFVLERLQPVQNHAELVSFLTDLANRWPVFAPLGNMEMGKAIESHKEDLTKDVLTKVKSGDIEGALEMAKGLTQHNNQ